MQAAGDLPGTSALTERALQAMLVCRDLTPYTHAPRTHPTYTPHVHALHTPHVHAPPTMATRAVWLC